MRRENQPVPVDPVVAYDPGLEDLLAVVLGERERRETRKARRLNGRDRE